MPDPALDVRRRIVRIGDRVLARRGRHQLHQPHGALRRPRSFVIRRLDLDQRADEPGVHPVLGRQLVDDLAVRNGLDRLEAASGRSAGSTTGSGYGTSSGVIRATTDGSHTISPPVLRMRTRDSPSDRCADTESVRPVLKKTISARAGAALATKDTKVTKDTTRAGTALATKDTKVTKDTKDRRRDTKDRTVG